MTDKTNRPDGAEHVYDTAPRPPMRTIDRADDPRLPTPDARAILASLVNLTEETRASGSSETMPAPHVGERFSQRQLARKVLAGRSYQAVQAWLAGEPIPQVTNDWLLHDLQRVDARAEERMVRVAEDEIAIVVKR